MLEFAGVGDAALAPALTAGVFRAGQAGEGHEGGSGSEAAEVAGLGRNGDRGDEAHAAQGLKCSDHCRQWRSCTSSRRSRSSAPATTDR
jgi:hypothetical protein